MERRTTAAFDPDLLRIAFDRRLAADAGPIAPLTLLRTLGFAELADGRVRLRRGPGSGNVADKLQALVASALAGGDCISDVEALSAGGGARGPGGSG